MSINGTLRTTATYVGQMGGLDLNFIVVLVEPGHPDEGLTPIQQINGVYGPFETSESADNWIATFQEQGSDNRFQFLITMLDSPPYRGEGTWVDLLG
jgi:hypothetical protein